MATSTWKARAAKTYCPPVGKCRGEACTPGGGGGAGFFLACAFGLNFGLALSLQQRAGERDAFQALILFGEMNSDRLRITNLCVACLYPAKKASAPNTLQYSALLPVSFVARGLDGSGGGRGGASNADAAPV